MKSEDAPLLEALAPFPRPADFLGARRDKQGRRLPQAIAHRGYKAEHPENTLAAFAGAVEVGAHAIETDIHLSKDGVVVLSHDATLKRCFGRDEKIIECDWEFLSKLRTKKAPHEPMPRLLDLLEYLASPERAHIWLMLDIKASLDHRCSCVATLTTIEAVPRSPGYPWQGRIVLGCWVADYLPLCHTYLPDFPITHIGFSITYARQFLKVPNVSFNLLQKVLMGPCGAGFLRDARAADRAVFVWTVNEDDLMRWSIRKDVDGVITDNPKRFLEICDGYDEQAGSTWLGPVTYLDMLRIHVLAFVFSLLLRWRYGFRISKRWTVPSAEGGR
ncbi:MAG: hypothetical protein M1832_003958 [Thelocarpon impressellum]|nr:MAG: hypothetical protein M1832_003958 [Thelocarpon impressellum]